MKKVLGLLTVALTVFAFVAVAGADDDYNRSEGEGHMCDKCPTGTIDCPGTRTIQGVQGATSTAEDPSYPFDYDGNPAVTGGFGSTGYCSGYNYADDETRNCKFIFDVCSCDEACAVEPGSKMGIQMAIKTPGVYWADPSMTTVYFDMFRNYEPHKERSACSVNQDAKPAVTTMETAPYYVDADGNRVGTASTAAGWDIRNFGPVEYYTQLNEVEQNSKGKFETTPSHLYSNEEPLAGEHSGVVPARHRVTVLQSFEATDYMFTSHDTADALGNCKIWIDMPAMRVDPTVVKAQSLEGQKIYVQVSLLFNRTPAGVCPECDPPDVCYATLEVGIICCETIVPEGDEYCMFFPYVLQGIQETAGWATGIAISAREDEMPDNAWIEMKLKDRAGNIATYRRESMGNGLVWAFVLDDEMDNFTGDTLVGGATSLTVKSNYSMDGYQFLNVAGTFGAGSNARGCKPGQCCPQ